MIHTTEHSGQRKVQHRMQDAQYPLFKVSDLQNANCLHIKSTLCIKSAINTQGTS